MAFMVFGLFWMVKDNAPVWTMALFTVLCLVENDWKVYRVR